MPTLNTLTNKEQMKKNKTPILIMIAVGIAVGVALGLWMVSSNNTSGFNILSIDTLLFMLLWAIMATFLHELGHMLFGFATGYKFVYFKLFGIIIFKKQDKWQTARDGKKGAIGQCLMRPDFKYHDKMPYLLYNAGGCIANFAFALLCFALIFAYSQNPFAIAGIVVNVVFVIINILPAKSMGSDGYHMKNIGITNDHKRAYWLELNMTADILQGKTFSDMPQHYFDFEAKDIHLENVAASLYMQYCYYVCTWQTQKATDLISNLYENRAKMPLSNANTICVEYFNHVMLFEEDKNKAITIYNTFDTPVKNAIQRVPVPFAIVAKILVNGVSAHNDMQFNLDCMVMQKIIDISKNLAETEYNNILFRQAKRKYGEVEESPFDI